MVITIIWALLSVIFLISEIFVPGALFFIGLSQACGVACVLALLNYSLSQQLICFIVISWSAYACALYSFRRKKNAIKDDPYISPLEALINQEIIIHRQIEYDDAGYASINGSEWLVRWHKNQSITLPQRARVVAIKGAHLKVEII